MTEPQRWLTWCLLLMGGAYFAGVPDEALASVAWLLAWVSVLGAGIDVVNLIAERTWRR